MARVQMIAAVILSAIAPALYAHSGHPTFDPNHTHTSFAFDPSVLLALAIGGAVVAVLGCAATRRAVQRVRVKK
jgi:polyisoprenoid-binding protein YceI